jgi:hypothetical protein
MSRTRPFRTRLWSALVAAPVLVACSSSDDSHSQPPPAVVLEGDASAAQLDTFLQQKARDWAWAGGQFDAPRDDATLAANPALTFAWHADPADFAQGGAAGEVVMTHLVLFSTQGQPDLLQVFSTLSEYTPDALHWQKLVDAHDPITISLTTGTFVGDDLPEDGGPFIGQTLTFTIE